MREDIDAKNRDTESAMHAAFASLCDEQKVMMYRLLRRAEDDAVRTVLGIVDGAIGIGSTDLELFAIDSEGRVLLNSRSESDLDDEFVHFVGYFDE